MTEGDSPAARLRLLAYVPHLERLGVRCRVFASRPPKYFTGTHEHVSRPWLSRSFTEIHGLQVQELNRYRDLLEAMSADVIYLQRDLQQPAWSRLDAIVPLFHDRVVFDFDDAIYAQSEEHARKLDRILASATKVIASTPALEGYARRLHDRTVVIPTPIDTERYTPAPERAANDPPVIGWIGTAGNLAYLREVLPSLEKVASTHRFRLRVMANEAAESEKPHLSGAPCEFVPWSEEGELPFLRSLDVGIMPLPDTEWTRGKAGFKLIQYMACGVPTVASPVGFNVDVVGTDGGCGVLAATHEEWASALSSLVSDGERRRAMGERGRARVAEKFDMRLHAATLARVLREAAAGSGFGGLTRGAPVVVVDREDSARARELVRQGREVVVVLDPEAVGDAPARFVKEGIVFVNVFGPKRPFFGAERAFELLRAFFARHAGSFERVEVVAGVPHAAAAPRAARDGGLRIA